MGAAGRPATGMGAINVRAPETTSPKIGKFVDNIRAAN